MNIEFLESAKELTGDSYPEFCKALDAPVVTSVRYNPLKKCTPLAGEQVAWCSNGVMLEERPSFTLDPIMHGGGYYVQESSSMFLESLVKPYIESKEGYLRALDLCAAPGGKSTHLAAMLSGRGVVVANEVIAQRSAILRENSQRWGSGNLIVTNSDPKVFGQGKPLYDILVIDAPCSGEGMFRKDIAAREQWSPANVELCAARSKRIISDAWDALACGGLLVFSTCTFNRKENEECIKWITESFDVENFEITPPLGGVTITEAGGISCYRFLPHLVKGEGLFMAAMVKGSGAERATPAQLKASAIKEFQPKKEDIAATAKWLADSDEKEYILSPGGDIYSIDSNDKDLILYLLKNSNVKYSGVKCGKVFKKELKPEHPLALYHNLSDYVPHIELGRDDALDFLRKKDIDATLFEMGVNTLCYGGVAIGFVKRIGGRYNTMLPQNMRIISL